MEEFVQLSLENYNSMRDDLKADEVLINEMQDEFYEVQRGGFELVVNDWLFKQFNTWDDVIKSCKHDNEIVIQLLINKGATALDILRVDIIQAINWLKEDFEDAKQR